MENVRRFKIFFLVIFLIFSVQADACVLVIVSGSQAWGSLVSAPIIRASNQYLGTNLHPMDEDISVNLFKTYKKMASQSRCRVEVIPDTNKGNFKGRIAEIAKRAQSRNESIQFSFTDHGSPSDAKKNALSTTSDIVVGSGPEGRISNLEFAELLKGKFKKNQRITFASNTCWSQFSELAIQANLDNQFDICGTGSTHIDNMSYNHREMFELKGKRVGPYLGVGIEKHNERFKNGKGKSSVFEFHNDARYGDAGNILKKPGYLTSMAYAKKILDDKKIPVEIDKNPLTAVFKDKQISHRSLESMLNVNLEQETDRITKALGMYRSGLNTTCFEKSSNPVDLFINNFGKIYLELIKNDTTNLPAPYDKRTRDSIAWIINNSKNVSHKFLVMLKTKAQFLKEKGDYLKNPKDDPVKYQQTEKEWNDLENRFNSDFHDLAFHMRNLQEAHTINSFLINANAAEKERFNKFIKCESSPMY